VELAARGRQEQREVPHALQVPHAHGAAVEHDQPVIVLATEDVVVFREIRAFDPFERRTRRLVLEGGSVRAAAGAQSLGESQSGERLLIRRADVVPESRGVGAKLLRVRRVTLGQPHPSSRETRGRHQRLAVEASGHTL
jgi:hypothetical protein